MIMTHQIIYTSQRKSLALKVCYGNSSRFANSTKLTSVIDVVEGSNVQLWCHYCHSKEDYNPKLWFYGPRVNIHLKQQMKEIEMNDDIVDDSIMSMTLSHILNLHFFKQNYSGVYTCKSTDNGVGNQFTYVLEGVIYVDVSPKVGTISQWQEYKRLYLDPVNKKIEMSQEEPFQSFRKKYNTMLKVYTVWDNWSECQDTDGHQKGKRKRLGRCRISAVNNSLKGLYKTNLSNNNIYMYLTDGYDVPCRSLKINETLPQLSRIIRNIPEFEAEEMCLLPKRKYTNVSESTIVSSNNRHKTTQQVMEDSHVTLMCNEVIPNSDLKWFKDKKILKSLYGNIFNKKEDEPHISIDSSNSLHILHISKNEEGNYTCSINGKKVKQFELKVVSKSKLLNQEFIRYSIYLGFVLSLTMTCYCAGVFVAWHRRASFADPLNLYKKKSFSNLKCEHEKLLK